MVRLDDVGLAGFGGGGLDHIGVDGALGQPVDVADLGGFLVEHIDKGVADNLALFLRIGDALQLAQEHHLRIRPDHFHAHVAGEHVHHLLTFILAQQAVVDKYTGQLVADGPVQQGRHHRRVHTAGQPQQYLVAAHLLVSHLDTPYLVNRARILSTNFTGFVWGLLIRHLTS